MKYLLITILLGVGYSQSVHLEIQNVNLTAGTLEVYMINEETVSGFQFSLDNIEIIGVSGGLVTDNGFMVSTTSTSVLAFTMSNTPIPPGQGILLVVSFLSQGNDNSICINTNGSNPPCLCSGNITYDFNFDNYSNVEDLILLVNCVMQGGSNCNGANPLDIVELANYIISYSTTFPLSITIVDNNGTSIPIDYNCEEECGAALGDVTGDSEINILDLVQIANLILETSTPAYECAADYTGDGQVNILDLVQIANCILDDFWDTETVCDYDGNCYATVQIGDHLWMAENLKVTHYNDGSEIPTGYSNSEWQDLHNTETGAYAVYPTDGDDASQEICGDNCADVFGNHYNYYAIYDGSGRNICPDGWHVPSNDEWTNLITYFDIDADPDVIWGNQSEIAGGMLKDTGTIEDGDGLWYSPNEGATNESGFTGLPAGYRTHNGGHFTNIHGFSMFWSSSAVDGNYALSRSMGYDGAYIAVYYKLKNYGFSIRCLGN